MDFKFVTESTIPKPILISGQDSAIFVNREFLMVRKNENSDSVYEIRFEYHCSPFKQALIIENILAVGHEENFYLFDLSRNEHILSLKLNGYFGHLYFDNQLFYVADMLGLYCIDKNGKILWKNDNLGIDGVIINSFSEDKIFGSGECDPPNNWRDFVLDKDDGKIIEQIRKFSYD